MPSRHRLGFSVFSLIIVLAILAILLALLLPAIAKVREAARRMQCQNNLKQIGLALHNYHDSYNRFPTIGTAEADHKVPNTGSWCFQILPYVEQEQLWRQNGGNAPVQTYYSPTRRPAALYADLPKIDYAGNAGTSDNPAKPNNDDGMFTKQGITFASVTDGLSNTLMAGVKGMCATEYLTGKAPGDKDSCWVGASIDALRSSNGSKRPLARDVPTEDHERGFGSPLSTCNFAFGDGSVRALRYTMNPTTFEYLCNRMDGMVIDFKDIE